VAELGEFLLDYVIKERVQRVLFFFVTLSCLSKAAYGIAPQVVRHV
jgi:hypothetical protein